MRWFASLLILSSAAVSLSAYAQLFPGGPSGDFRVNDRPGTAPTAGPAGGPSLPPTPMMFQDMLGPKSSDEILRSIDKDLGRPTAVRPDSSSLPYNFEKDLRTPSDPLK